MSMDKSEIIKMVLELYSAANDTQVNSRIARTIFLIRIIR